MLSGYNPTPIFWRPVITGTKMITPPVGEPVTLAEAKAHLRVDITDDDALITSLITVGRQAVEAFLWRALMTQTWQVAYSAFPPTNVPFVLVKPPLQTVNSIIWKDWQANVTTIDPATYTIDNVSEPGLIALQPFQVWPSLALWPVLPITISITAGYGDATTVPEKFKLAIKMFVAHWYANREPIESSGAVGKELPKTVEWLLWQDRAPDFTRGQDWPAYGVSW